MSSTYADTRRLNALRLARTDALLTMALSLIDTAGDDLRHVEPGVFCALDESASAIRVQRAIIRSRLAESDSND